MNLTKKNNQTPSILKHLLAIVVVGFVTLDLRVISQNSPEGIFFRVQAQKNENDPEVIDRQKYLNQLQSYTVPGGQPTVSATSSIAPVQATTTTSPEVSYTPLNLPFPHLALYGRARSDGPPFVDISSPSKPLVNSVLDAYAKRPLVILNATPLADARKDIATGLRVRNPNIKIFGYTLGSLIWCVPQYGPTLFFRHYWEIVEAYDGDSEPYENCDGSGNGFLWKLGGQPSDTLSNVNLAHRVQLPDGSYRYDLAEALADLFYNDIYLPTAPDGTKIFDGIFLDAFCSCIDANYYDFTRAGYADDASFGQGWKEGFLALTSRLRSLITDPDYPIVANAGSQPTWTYPYFNGQMVENFPYQPGTGGWSHAMFDNPGGYFLNNNYFRSPQYNFIFTAVTGPAQPYSPYNQLKQRFGLGSATLGNGFHSFEDQAIEADQYDYYNWWYDEYAVDLATGRASTRREDEGWLGQPTSDAYQVVWDNPTPDLVTSGSFETDLTGWNLTSLPPAVASVSRDDATAGAGSSSARVHIDQAGTQSQVRFGSGAVSVQADEEFSVTFWAKASAPRRITATLGGGYETTFGRFVTTSWQRYQLVIKPYSTGLVNAWFDVGDVTGDVWLDDIRVQRGATNVFRRNFENGIVLVNPYDVPLTVNLERPYKKISGTVSREINNGSIVSSITLTPDAAAKIGDAIFLLNVDVTPPATITDLKTADGAYTITIGKKRVQLQPFGKGYLETIWAKRVKFRSPSTTWYIFANNNRATKGAIKMYNAKGKLVRTVRPTDKAAVAGIRAAIAVQRSSKKVVLAALDKGRNGRIRFFELTPKQIHKINDVAVGGNPRNRTVLLAFLKLYISDNVFVAAVRGQPSSLRVWKYGPSKKIFVRDTSPNSKRIDTKNGRFQLKPSSS
ncbi:MAG: carbohydrate binding domain-containing protein [Candidatus Kerfeldbacteria bacterium]|nr:carbohydrate binding domain-containing protein [Candidatus Kerfeldbacteria bacterium]